jgi:hypothetical protein
VTVCLDTVRPEPVAWLWRHWIPRRAVTILDGDPGLGKSTITLDWAARVTRGWPMPGEERQPGEDLEPAGVLLLSAEDDLACTIRPRLDAAGADPSRVVSLEAVRTEGEERPPVLPWDLGLVEAMIRERGIALVIIDPFMAYLDAEINAHQDQDVRRALHRLKLMAERTGAAVVVVRHLNKLVGGPAIYRGGGSIGIVGAARSALLVGRDPDDPSRLVLAGNKSNLGPLPRSIRYALETVGDVARISWGEKCDLKAADILGHPGGRQKKNAGQQCAHVLRGFLASGARPSADLEKMLKDAGFSERAFKEARQLLKTRAFKSAYGGAWLMELPGTPGEEGGAEGGQTKGDTKPPTS